MISFSIIVFCTVLYIAAVVAEIYGGKGWFLFITGLALQIVAVIYDMAYLIVKGW